MGFSKDDEYLRLALYERDDVMSHPTAQALKPDAVRAFDKPAKQGFARMFERHTERWLFPAPRSTDGRVHPA